MPTQGLTRVGLKEEVIGLDARENRVEVRKVFRDGLNREHGTTEDVSLRTMCHQTRAEIRPTFAAPTQSAPLPSLIVSCLIALRVVRTRARLAFASARSRVCESVGSCSNWWNANGEGTGGDRIISDCAREVETAWRSDVRDDDDDQATNS